MSMEYVRNRYGVPVKRGGRVQVNGKAGTITSATHYVFIRFDGEKKSKPFNPTELKYLER